MPRDMGRNPKKGFVNSTRTIEMCQLAEGVIDREIVNGGGRMENLKDIVFDELVMHLPWWDPSWVDYPGFCDYGGSRHGAWVCIRMWWSRQNHGQALRWEQDAKVVRPGVSESVWYVIASWDEAMPIISTTLDDNADRIANDLQSFETLMPRMGNQAILRAMQAAPVFVQMHYDLIEAATFISALLAAAGATGLGWTVEDDAIQAVENRCHFGNSATRDVGRQLWAVHP